MGFSISCPVYQQLEREWARVDIRHAHRQAARHVALEHLVDHLHAAAKAAGASRGMLSDIGVFDDGGNVVVGVPSGGPYSQEAVDLEYGTAVGAPHGWLRTTIARHKPQIEHAMKIAVFDAIKNGPK